jgi:hypothetical protein
LLCEYCPPYEPKEAELGEKANHDSHSLFRTVVDPTVTVTVSFVPCRLEGLTEICSEFEETSNPLMNTLMTGLSVAAKGDTMVA